jgi:hypothetical protein
MQKYERLVSILRQRLADGDYATRPLPSERDLARELGVSYLTARKAVLQLIADGLLVRTGRGRAEPTLLDGSAHGELTLLTYGWPSRSLLRIERAFTDAATARHLAFRCHRFLHWDDHILTQILARPGGTLLVPPAEDPTQAGAALLREARTRVVLLGSDGSSLGLHSIDPLPADGIRLALDHLTALGHRRLAVANVQPHCPIIRARLAEAHAWTRAHPEIRLTLSDQPVRSGEDSLSAARLLARSLLTGPDPPNAVLGLTLPMAMGALRAAADLGEGGIATVAIDGQDMADGLVPSITAVEIGDLESTLSTALVWMAGGEWDGPQRLACPAHLAQRETSIPACA